MTEKAKGKRLSREVLGILAVSFAIAFFLFQVLSMAAIAIIENHLFLQDIVLTDMQYAEWDTRVFRLSLLISVAFFVILFLFLLGDHLAYIQEILIGIHSLESGKEDYIVPIKGSNELTHLAMAVNYLSQTQREIQQKECMLREEKEQFIRALSHDIRTPLTSIMAYSDLLVSDHKTTPEEQVRYLTLIQHKASQIKDMTDILLDGSKRNLEHFEDAHLLMEQLIGEFEEMLEDNFQVETSLDCPALPGTFDVQELRRIFDNLISNVKKYAEPAKPVKLSIHWEDAKLIIQQENAVKSQSTPVSGYQIGLRSIQRIVQNYEGRVDIQKDDANFLINIILSKI